MSDAADIASWDEIRPGEEGLDAPADEPSHLTRELRQCGNCGQDFQPTKQGWTARYCSHACMRAANGLPAKKRTAAEIAIARARATPPPPPVRQLDVAAAAPPAQPATAEPFDAVDLTFLLMSSPTFRALDADTAKAIIRESLA
jgi:hypothetical protein